MIKLSVIVCTYNPRFDIFRECLENLLTASLKYQPFEILIIDNNSTHPVEENVYVKEFARKETSARVIVEKTPGLTPARLRGIRESKGDLLLFVDDDNFIAEDFFVNGISVAQNWSSIGSWSGQVDLVFESPPPEWTRKYWGMLVCRKFNGVFWSNLPHLPETMPCGAGLFVRRDVANHYHTLHETGKRAIQLDRTGKSLLSGGDNDLAACACDIGLGVGIFDTLKLNHFIPSNRTTKEYLLKLAEGISHSGIVFRNFRGEKPRPLTMKNRMANALRLLIKKGFDRDMQKAVYRGESAGRKMIANTTHDGD
jgi:glycosyltransferase involved in cell wall biosynthesis